MNKLATALFVILLSAPVGVAATELDATAKAVENHTTYVQILVEEQDHRPQNEYAAVAGLVACRPATSALAQAVLWFNDQLLFQAPGAQQQQASTCSIMENTHVWAVEEGNPDPRKSPGVEPTGEVYEFTDPNGIDWEVVEYRYYEVVLDHVQSTSLNSGPVNVALEAEAQARFIEHLTWVVELGPNTLDPTLAEEYNFVVLLNLTKMDRVREDQVEHDGSAGNVRGGNSHDADRPDEDHSFPHDHDAAKIHLYTGEAPDPSGWPHDGEGVRLRVNDATVEKGFRRGR